MGPHDGKMIFGAQAILNSTDPDALLHQSFAARVSMTGLRASLTKPSPINNGGLTDIFSIPLASSLVNLPPPRGISPYMAPVL